MNITPLIKAIASGENQPSDLIQDFIAGIAERSVAQDVAVQWLKAVHRSGCTPSDKVFITQAMMASGAQLTWPEGPPVVDKHSTGGVGDKMSLMLAPALAACGCRVPMLAGRGLGHTGGTIDKLESIPGFRCALTPKEMVAAVERVGCCIAVQNEAIAPADGVLYALRDVTQTIDSVPLITASIVSKKAAEGLDALVLDVKVGSAAFMKSMEEARELATSMVETAEGLGVRTMAQITEMSHPIGTHVGNALEVVESIHVLKGGGSSDTRSLVIMQGAALLSMTLNLSEQEAEKRMEEVLDNGKALEVFAAMCEQQGVSETTVQRLIHQPESVVERARETTTVVAPNRGFLHSIDALTMANIAREHGAGRFGLNDKLDLSVGFVVHVERGKAVREGDPIFTFHHRRSLPEATLAQLTVLPQIVQEPVSTNGRLLETVQFPTTKP